MSTPIRIEDADVRDVEQLASEWIMAIREHDYNRALDIALDMLDRCTCSTREPLPF